MDGFYPEAITIRNDVFSSSMATTTILDVAYPVTVLQVNAQSTGGPKTMNTFRCDEPAGVGDSVSTNVSFAGYVPGTYLDAPMRMVCDGEIEHIVPSATSHRYIYELTYVPFSLIGTPGAGGPYIYSTSTVQNGTTTPLTTQDSGTLIFLWSIFLFLGFLIFIAMIFNKMSNKRKKWQ